MNRCPQCGTTNISTWDFMRPNLYCYECDRVLQVEVGGKGILYSIYYFFKHLYYRHLFRR